MAKEKSLRLSGDRDLGAVTKKLSSGMFQTSKGEKVPPLPGITIGTKMKLVKNRFEIVGEKEKEQALDQQAVLEAENADLKKRMSTLEKAVGTKGASVKATPATPTLTGADTDATPPKVGA